MTRQPNVFEPTRCTADPVISRARILALAVLSAFAVGASGGVVWVIWKYGVSALSFALLAAWICALLCLQWRVPFLILSIALLPRLVLAIVVGGENAFRADPKIYEQLARGIIDGQGMVWRAGGVVWHAAYPPAYPLLLAGGYAVSNGSGFAPVLLNTAIDLGTAFIIFRAVGPQFGTILGALYLLWPSMIVASIFPQKEGLVSLIVAALVATYRDLKDANRFALFGILCGFLALTQPALAPFSALLGLVALITSPSRWRLIALAAGAATIIMAPWWVHNFIEVGAFIPLTTSSGLNAFVEARGWDYTSPAWALPEAQRSALMLREGFSWVLGHPTEWLVKQARSVFLAFSLDQAHVETLQNLRNAWLAPEAFALVMQVPLCGLWVAGAWAAHRLPSKTLYIIFFCLLIDLAAFQIWFEFAQRHRVAFVPIIFLWVGYALSSVQSDARCKHNGVG